MFHRLGLILNREVRRGYAPSKTPLPPRLRKERGIQGVRLIHNNQKGFTLVELIVAIAITALIVGVIVASIFQLFNINARSNSHMLAVRQVQNAGYWISHDVQMAQSVVTAVDPDGFLDVTWWSWGTTDLGDTTLHEVTYTLLGNGELKRSYSVNGGGSSEILVAQYIESIEVAPIPFTTGDKLVLTVTAGVGTWPKVESETRVYEIIPRPE